MWKENALRIKVGDIVKAHGKWQRVLKMKVSGKDSPYFYLDKMDEYVSYQLLREKVRKDGERLY